MCMYMYLCIYRWMNECVDVYMYRCVNVWLCGHMYECVCVYETQSKRAVVVDLVNQLD